MFIVYGRLGCPYTVAVQKALARLPPSEYIYVTKPDDEESNAFWYRLRPMSKKLTFPIVVHVERDTGKNDGDYSLLDFKDTKSAVAFLDAYQQR